jgi:hypothetical protein
MAQKRKDVNWNDVGPDLYLTLKYVQKRLGFDNRDTLPLGSDLALKNCIEESLSKAEIN